MDEGHLVPCPLVDDDVVAVGAVDPLLLCGLSGYLVAAYVDGLSFHTHSDEDKHLTLGELLHFLLFELPLLPLAVVGLIYVIRERVAGGILNGTSYANSFLASACLFMEVWSPNNRVSKTINKMPRAAQKTKLRGVLELSVAPISTRRRRHVCSMA